MWSADDGVTIVELLIALVIIMTVFAGLASTIITALGSIRNNEARAGAVALANELVEEMASVPWEQLGLSEGDPYPDFQAALATAQAASTVLTYEGEAVVLLDPAANPIPLHRTTVPRDGLDYEVERWVTWFEEDSQPELKRMIAIVSWSVGGQQATIRSDALRSPDFDEQFDLEVNVSVASSYGGSDGTADGLDLKSDGTYVNDHQFIVTAELGDVPNSSELRFRDRGDVLRSLPTPDVFVSGTTTRTWTIPEDLYEFRHGRTAFTVFAEGEAGQLASDTATLRFYQALSIQLPELEQNGQVVAVTSPPPTGETTSAPDTPTAKVDLVGSLCAPLHVEVDVEGMTPAESTPDAEGNGGLELRGSVLSTDQQMGLVEATAFGGRYFSDVTQADLTPSFVDELLAMTDGMTRTVQLDIHADRLGTAPFADTKTRTFAFEVEVVETCPA